MVRRTAAKYRELYDEDLREAVAGETSGDYGKLVGLALAPKDVFFADIIDKVPNPDPSPSRSPHPNPNPNPSPSTLAPAP